MHKYLCTNKLKYKIKDVAIKENKIILKYSKLKDIPIPKQIIKYIKTNGFITEPYYRISYSFENDNNNNVCGFCNRKAYS